jgi:diguanylate cyclase (GGDEF)-like protein
MKVRKLVEIGDGLRALEVTEERELAGQIAGLLYLTASFTALLLLVLPGTPVTSVATVLIVAGFGIAWGLTCLFLIPWQRANPLVSHLSSGMGLPITAIAMAATGGAESPARFYLLFIVFYASYFYPPREAIPHLIGCVVVLLLPLAYDANAIEGGLLAETLVLAPTFFVLGALIMGGRRVLLTLSRRDPLTGLVNRRAFEQTLWSSIERSRDPNFGLMLCDLDSFKSVNDRHGHPEGDRVLCRTADTLKAAVRFEDTVARVGGDEFAIVVDGADDASMRALADRIHSELREAGERLDLDGFALHASLGWAIFPGEADSAEALVARADLALRDQKLAADGSWPRRRTRAVEPERRAIAGSTLARG